MADGSGDGRVQFPLHLDEPTNLDLLSFGAVASTVTDALTDDELDPIALGLSGTWGSGKTTVLRLIAAELGAPQSDEDRHLVVETDPWRYDPGMGAKESLIGDVLVAIENEIPPGGVGDDARALLRRLTHRIDWGKALKLAASSAITVSLPNLDQLFELVKPKDEDAEPAAIIDMVAFRAEFERLLGLDELSHLRGVVVLVDDLDRCLPATVVETLETIRLFLSVPKMSFVIAADEHRVAEAIRAHFPKSTTTPGVGEEAPSQMYLHKIVQTSVPLPALSEFDTEAYLVLLQGRSLMSAEDYALAIDQVATVRKAGGSLDDVSALADPKYAGLRNYASRIKPIVHEKTLGNPRRIKRFLNDVSVRLRVADRRGIELEAGAIAKLMVLEQYFPTEFKTVTGWLRAHTLRANIADLERRAGAAASASVESSEASESPADSSPDDGASGVGVAGPIEDAGSGKADPDRFEEGLLRWARLYPRLSDQDLSSYLVFAASFQRILLTSEGLPEGLRDIASNLTSRAISDNRSVADADLASLSPDDATELARHLGGVAIDQPARQTATVGGLIRLARHNTESVAAVVAALQRLPAGDLKPGGLIMLQPNDREEIFEVLEALVEANGGTELRNTLEIAKEGDL